MVQADAYGRAVLLANGNEPGELLPCLLMVGMEVAGIDADLIHERRDRKGRLGGEMDIRHGSAEVTGRLCVIGSKLDEENLKTLFGV